MKPAGTYRIPSASGDTLVLDWSPPTSSEPRVAVYVHGLASHRQGEKALCFAEGFQRLGWGFLRYDMRGHGESGGEFRDLTLTRCLEDLRYALDSLALPAEPLLIGSSMGAAIVAWYRVKQESRAPVAMLAPALSFPNSLRWRMGAEAVETWRREGLSRLSEDPHSEMRFALLEDGLDYNPLKLVRSYRAATWIAHGVQDDIVPWRGSQSFVEDCPQAETTLLLLSRGDHRLTAERSYLLESLLAWLKRPEIVQSF